MTEPILLQRLLTWLSPAFPVGGFAWSQGLETAITDERVFDASTLREWIAGTIAHGGLRTDGIFLAQAHRNHESAEALAELADLAFALAAPAERYAELCLTGEAFTIATRAWPSVVYAHLPDRCPYPVAVGAIAAAHQIPLLDTLAAYLTAAVHAQISVAVRLVPLGQTAGLQVMAALEPTIERLAEAASTTTLDDLGTVAYAADIAQMRHETLPVRVFRS
ncbi:MAG TPA: urease accessory UreF family protein [Devosia sp.]|nr:urease accessory UreF family protein [Devosia sp.]